MDIKRIEPVLKANIARVILRRRGLHGRLEDFTRSFLALDDKTLETEWNQTLELFAHRHRDFEQRLLAFADQGLSELDQELDLTPVQRRLFGAYLSMEYTIEAAALFNPSIVPHFHQDKNGSLRFVLSLRAVGEGHISSIEFMEGYFHQDGSVELDDSNNWRTMPTITSETTNLYRAEFHKDVPIGERVLFPQTSSESNGMEDLRLVEFTHESGDKEYLGTYTAYDGHHIQSKMLRTKDFRRFEIANIAGNAIIGKGIAFFPRQVNGKYCAIGRQDGVNISIMWSDSLTKWETYDTLITPEYGHDLTQLGNCGAPIETPEGWLLLTHGVGPVRRYTLGMALLDLDDPSHVIGYLPMPFMQPQEDEREGYVPNVLYTCGMLAHGDRLLIPYAMSDTRCGFATCSIREIVQKLKAQ